jgi:hypothetical protein
MATNGSTGVLVSKWCGGAREAVTGIVPGTEKQPVQLADVRAALVAEQLIDA